MNDGRIDGQGATTSIRRNKNVCRTIREGVVNHRRMYRGEEAEEEEEEGRDVEADANTEDGKETSKVTT